MRISDWSSDVCSSDLLVLTRRVAHQVFYRIGEGSVREIMTVLYHVYCRKVEAINQGRMMAAGATPMMPMAAGAMMPQSVMPNPDMARPPPGRTQLGRQSWRERVGQSGEFSGGA